MRGHPCLTLRFSERMAWLLHLLLQSDQLSCQKIGLCLDLFTLMIHRGPSKLPTVKVLTHRPFTLQAERGRTGRSVLVKVLRAACLENCRRRGRRGPPGRGWTYSRRDLGEPQQTLDPLQILLYGRIASSLLQPLPC